MERMFLKNFAAVEKIIPDAKSRSDLLKIEEVFQAAESLKTKTRVAIRDCANCRKVFISPDVDNQRHCTDCEEAREKSGNQAA